MVSSPLGYEELCEALLTQCHFADDENELDEATLDDLRSGKAAQAAAGSSAPGIQVRHLMKLFDPTLATGKALSGPDADETGFYGTYRKLFERLAEEERLAAPYPGEENGEAVAYPSFGYAHTPYAFAKGEEATVHQTPVKDFYSAWAGFSSRKGFAWVDGYRMRDAPDRRVRRLMEKDNKKTRDAARRDLNDTVRSLVAFVRKRDPRVKAWHERNARDGPEAKKRMQQAAQEATRKAEERKAAAERYRSEKQGWQQQEIEIDSEFDSSSEGEDDEEDSSAGEEDEGASAGSDGGGDEEEEEPSAWTCVACDKFFQTEAAWLNHEKSKKHKQEVKRLRKEMQDEDAEFGFDEDAHAPTTNGNGGAATAGFALPSEGQSSSKKAKKKQRKQRKAQEAAEAALDSDDDLEAFKMKEPLESALKDTNKTAVQGIAEPAEIGPPKERPPGSFDVFGYGSLIFKPPPHVIGRTPGYIKGFARRFAQSSIDHRGTPERPGRVVTLISAEDWAQFKEEENFPEIVWGFSYTIDPAHAKETKDYLDWREKNGYTEQRVTIWASETEKVVEDALVYVGLPGNEAFVGPSPMDELALRIFTCEGPSGRNDEYVLNLAEAVRKLGEHVQDPYLFMLEEKVLALKRKAAEDEEAAAAAPRGAEDDAVKANGDTGAKEGKGKKGKKSADAKGGKGGSELCNVCKARFQSRSKLFNHIRDTGHAAAQQVDEEDWEDERGTGKRGKAGKKRR